ncbi:pre-mRNA-splicing factor 38B-like isoform X1 [Tigriopus californicus]|uniref:pre-mRNA-splicing factor 38B-like isoform X1 n=1 Tax=Tigriopus californicus TaxID=6832 RepID=UPI0027D9F9E9|nr:pre-mRNA-splicing factor 38B-like isoform X1 [Tigriopus californicus]
MYYHPSAVVHAPPPASSSSSSLSLEAARGAPFHGNEAHYNGGHANVDEEEDDDDPTVCKNPKQGNVLPIHGNAATLNINNLILTNIQGSPYFKVSLFALKTYHEVIDEIYYKVDHLEPWERGSRKTSGQTGMCGGVRGVGAGGIVSSAYCLLFKLGTLKLTRKQLNGLINHSDSPYIRGLGFMYIRYTQSPSDLWEWFEPYLEDTEMIDVKAGGGKQITIGAMVKSFLEKLEWFDTRFPRIPVHTQKQINANLEEYYPSGTSAGTASFEPQTEISERSDDRSNYREPRGMDHRSPDARKTTSRRSRDWSESRSKDVSYENDRDSNRKREREHSRHKHARKKRSRSRSRSRSRDDGRKRSHKKTKERRRSRSRDRDHNRRRDDPSRKERSAPYEDELRKYSKERKKSKKHRRSRSRS